MDIKISVSPADAGGQFTYSNLDPGPSMEIPFRVPG